METLDRAQPLDGTGRPVEPVVEAVAAVPETAVHLGKTVFVVANRTGGQGKTLVSQLLLAAHPAFKAFSADAETAEGESKLVRLMRNDLSERRSPVEELGIGWSLEEAGRQDGSSMFWDGFGGKLLDPAFVEPGALIDMGANVVGSLVSWGRGFNAKRLFGGKIRFVFVIPVVASPQAVRDAEQVVASLSAEGERGLPVGGVVLVRNAWQGVFPQAIAADLEKVREAHPAMGITVVDLDVADPLISKRFEEASEPAGNIRFYDAAALNGKFKLNFFQADRSGDSYRAWFDKAVRTLSGVAVQARVVEREEGDGDGNAG